MDRKSEFIKFMMDSGVISFGDFTAKSGRRTPYFINTGKFCEGNQIARLGNFYADCIMSNMVLEPEKTVLFGPAYKGISLAVSTAIALAERGKNFKFCFNRKEAKDHGEGGNLIGRRISEGDRVVIIEDVITAGTSVREVLPIVQSSGAIADSLVIAVDRMERGIGGLNAVREIWEEFGIRTYAIVSLKDILEYISNSLIKELMQIDDDILVRMKQHMNETTSPAN